MDRVAALGIMTGSLIGGKNISFGGSAAMDTITSTTLLEGLKDARNHEAWHRFVLRYEPMVVSFAMKPPYIRP